MSKHTLEPWSFDKYDNIIAGDEMLLLGGIRTPMTAGPRMDEGRANARRIVACVNACRELTTEDLEYVGLVSAVGNQLLSADNRAEGQEREIHRLAHVAANAENELAGALNQLDELKAVIKELELLARQAGNVAYNLGQSHKQWPSISQTLNELDAVRMKALNLCSK